MTRAKAQTKTRLPRAKFRGRKGQAQAKERANGGSSKRIGEHNSDKEEHARARAKTRDRAT